ncbi:NUDIX hydrolase [Helicobacter muridarum]|nr:NUDIX hydrolase [Helicobacter muridarum]
MPTPNPPTIIDISPIEESKYLSLQRVTFNEQGINKTWDITKSHDSVAIVLYHRERDGFIFVRQFRVGVFLQNNKHGYMYELCAGLYDKNIDTTQIAIEEIQEECGYFISKDRIELITQLYGNVGMSGAKQYLFYAEIKSKDKKSAGGGVASELENIELIFVPRALIDEFIDDLNCPKTPSLCYGILWSKGKKF